MYQILSIELEDEAVEMAFESIANDRQSVLPKTGGNFVLITDNSIETVGTGNPLSKILIIIGHGSPNGISSKSTWGGYWKALDKKPDLPNQIWVVSCSTAGEGDLFAYGNFAQTVKVAYPSATVWASETNVDAKTLEGDWVKVKL